MLAPGDPVEKLVERELIAAADGERLEELVHLVHEGAVRAGQVVALSLGAPPERVAAVGKLFEQGGEAGGD